MVNFDIFWGLKFVLKCLMLIISDVWRIGRYSSHLWRTGATFSRVWRIGTNSSHMSRIGTNSSHMWRIRWWFLTCKELVSIRHTCDLCFWGCEELVPITLTRVKNWYQFLLHVKNWYQFLLHVKISWKYCYDQSSFSADREQIVEQL